MQEGKNISMIPDESLINKIYSIREQKVMLDSDLAELYGVETRVLNQAINRNMTGFHLISCFNQVLRNGQT